METKLFTKKDCMAAIGRSGGTGFIQVPFNTNLSPWCKQRMKFEEQLEHNALYLFQPYIWVKNPGKRKVYQENSVFYCIKSI